MPQTSPLLNQSSREASAALPTVEFFFQSVARRLRARMVNRNAADVPIRVSGVEVRNLGGLLDISEFRNGVVLGGLRFGPSRLPGLIMMQHALLTRLLSVLLGEEGIDTDSPTQLRSLTPVERRIASRLCQDLITEILGSWPASAPPKVEFSGLISSSQTTEASFGAVPAFTATLDLGHEESPLGLMMLAVPLHTLSGLVESQEAPSLEVSQPSGSLASVMPVELEVVVELTHLQLTVNELRGLQVGDVLPLGVLRESVLKVNGYPLFEGQAGISGGNRSLKLIRRVGR